MASPIEICNKGLTLIGAKTIESFDEESPEARACKLLWPMIRDRVLRSHPWNCAIERVTFTRLTETPSYGFRYYFQKPTDCLFVYDVEPEQFFEVEGNKILADSEKLAGRIIKKQTDTTKYDAQLSDAFSYLVAGELSYMKTSSANLGQGFTQKGEELLAEARASDALEGRTQNKRNNRWLTAKYGGR